MKFFCDNMMSLISELSLRYSYGHFSVHWRPCPCVCVCVVSSHERRTDPFPGGMSWRLQYPGSVCLLSYPGFLSSVFCSFSPGTLWHCGGVQPRAATETVILYAAGGITADRSGAKWWQYSWRIMRSVVLCVRLHINLTISAEAVVRFLCDFLRP